MAILWWKTIEELKRDKAVLRKMCDKQRHEIEILNEAAAANERYLTTILADRNRLQQYVECVSAQASDGRPNPRAESKSLVAEERLKVTVERTRRLSQ